MGSSHQLMDVSLHKTIKKPPEWKLINTTNQSHQEAQYNFHINNHKIFVCC